MEIKHTFEILAKDIQDIEKLVRNIQNSPKPSSLDFDLALAKIRNVYEVLLMIREDNLGDEKSADMQHGKQAEVTEKQTDEFDVANEVIYQETQQVTEETKDISVDTVGQEIKGPETVPGDEEPVKVEIEESQNRTEKKEVAPVQDEPVRTRTDKPKKEAEILAEKFNKESSINENLGLKRQGDMTSKLASQPIDSISRNIGINDRFYIIKELFKGDSDGFNLVIRNLDQSTNFNEAFHILENRFPDTLDHDGVQILVNLVRRRFISSGNV